MAEDEDLAGDGVIAVERFLPQRRSPGQRSQDSGFSGYSGDSASEGSAPSSNNNSPVPAAAIAAASSSSSSASSTSSTGSGGGKRSPLSDPEEAERILAAEPAGRVLETDLDATPSRLHVSRIYIRSSTPESAAVSNLNLRDVLCEKKIQPVNLSGSESSSTSPDKCVGDKSLISAMLANTQAAPLMNNNNNINRNNNNNNNHDQSCDSQTALLLEHKSIVPPSSMRPNLSWKKLSESFRRVISSGRMMAAGSSTPTSSTTPTTTTTTSQSCLPSVADADESFTDEEKSRMLLLGKRSNLRRMKTDCIEEQSEEMTEGGRVCRAVQAASESPQPTSRYLGGPRSSTPRKTLPDNASRRYRVPMTASSNNNNNNHNNNNNNNNQRRCSRLDDRPRVHWADIDPVVNGEDGSRRKQPQPVSSHQVVNGHLAAVVTSWPDNSTWDSDTPSLEIGQQVTTSHPVHQHHHHQLAAPAGSSSGMPDSSNRKIRRGLRMGVGVDRSSLLQNSHQTRKIAAHPQAYNQHPMIIPAPVEFRSYQSTTVPASSAQQPLGLR